MGLEGKAKRVQQGAISFIEGVWNAAPLAGAGAGSMLLGLIFVFGEVTYTDPVIPEWYARQILRAIGLFFIWSPIWVPIRVYFYNQDD